MIEVAIMIEGQNGVNWPRWKRIVRSVEDAGYVGLYRSDHYTNADPPDLDALELWVSLTWLASHTRRIEFGPLVSPVSFRHPTHTARMAIALDNLSDGRLTLGLGAGWQEREHRKFGWDLLSVTERFVRFEEGLEVITRLLKSDESANYQGKYYHLEEAVLLPRPKRPGGPAILVGGNGAKRTLPLAARFASEWNAVFLPPEEFTRLNVRLDELLREQGRRPESVRRSMMTGCIFSRDQAEVERMVNERTQGKRTADQLRQRGLVVGTAGEVINQLERLAEAGVQRVMLQWLDLDGIERLEAMAASVLPQVQA